MSFGDLKGIFGRPVGRRSIKKARFLVRANNFDACRTERVLQHVKQPETAISEMVRVTKPGGRIVAIEPDWGTLMIDSANPELTRKIVGYKSYHRIASGWIGRQLRRLFFQNGMRDIEVHFLIGRHEEFGLADRLLGLSQIAERCAAKGIISQDDATKWIGDLRQFSVDGVFFAALVRVVVAASKASA